MASKGRVVRSRCLKPINLEQHTAERRKLTRPRISNVDNDNGLPDTESESIIESRETAGRLEDLDDAEVDTGIQRRRQKVFLLLEEIRRLRLQQTVRSTFNREVEAERDRDHQFRSAIPFLPPLRRRTLRTYVAAYAIAVTLVLTFGGYVAPLAELKMGIGSTSYAEFIHNMGLPEQLSNVDPIVASFTGGAVGVLTALLMVEADNVHTREKEMCLYCRGEGYLACAACHGEAGNTSCSQCYGGGRVMCISCLSTGKQLARETDERLQPFDKPFN